MRPVDLMMGPSAQCCLPGSISSAMCCGEKVYHFLYVTLFPFHSHSYIGKLSIPYIYAENVYTMDNLLTGHIENKGY